MHCSLRRFLLILAIVSLFGVLPGLASAQEVTVFGSQNNTNSTGNYVKANRYDVTADVNLDQFEIRYRTYATNRPATFAVWQADSNGVFQVIWEESLTLNSWNWAWRAVTPDIPLEAGEAYAVGMWFGTTVSYAFDNNVGAPNGQPSWGTVNGLHSSFNTSFPNILSTSGWFSLSGYNQTLTVSYTIDADGDGFFSDVDCDDTNPTVYPGAIEACDGLDTDCDGLLPPDEFDLDNDGMSECEGDCDDDDPGVNPDALEAPCDGVDTDCDGSLHPDEADGDGDGITVCDGDCDDDDPAVYPGALEICNGIDDNCDGDIDEGLTFDVDGDGHTSMDSCAGSADDCDDEDDTIFPGAPEICDALDNDCDGELHPDESDIDGDGISACDGDCDDANPNAYPGAEEDICDEVDIDCDGVLPTREGCDDPPDGDDDDGSGSLTGVGCQGCESSSVVSGGSPRSLFGLLLMLATLRRRRRREAAHPTDTPAACN
jgi:MYXO-CTERM domain-containing protein